MPAASPSHPSSPPLSSSGETAAVRPYDLDTVFLSKTVVSLDDVFAHSVNGPFDVSPMYTPKQQCTEQQQKLQEAAATTPAHMRLTSLPFSGGSAPYTSSSPKLATRRASTRAAGLRPNAVVRGADGQWRAVSPDRGAPTTASASSACWKPPSQEARARMQLVPLDSYHFLLTYRDVDSAGQLRKSCDKRTETTTVERLAASSPGRRPPRSGICVVRRLEGEQRHATRASSASMAAPMGAASATYPTLSRVARGLPLDAFDGWVRDYTVYGLSCNEAVLHAAWEDKTRERAFALPTDVIAVVGESTAAVHEAVGGDGSREARSLCRRGGSLGEHVDSVGIAVPRAGNNGGVAIDEGAAADGMEEATCVSADAVRAAKASPSLDRLHCSSTTTSSLAAASTPSPFTERNRERSGEVAARGAEEGGGGAAEPFSAALASAAAPQHQQAFLLWEEERQRAERAAAQLRHRFLVSDSAQHAIWALEVRLPSMEVRAVAPAELYTPEVWQSTEEVSSAARHGEEDGTDVLAARHAAGTHEEPAVAPSPGIAFPRKKPAYTSTHDHAAASGHRGSAKSSPDTDASGPRSPSPAEPSTTTHAGAADSPGDSRPYGNAARRCSTSVETHYGGGASCSTQRCRRSVSSASPSLAMAEAVPTPLMGGSRGFVDGHFSVARFHSPGALCWRIEDDEDDDKGPLAGGGGGSDDGVDGGVLAASRDHEGRGQAPTRHFRVGPVSYLRRRRCCSVLFISDMGNCAIRYANFHNHLVRTITGVDGVPGYRDGSCVSSLLRGATALAWCSAGLLFTDGANSVLRLITGIRKRRTQEPERESGEGTAGADAGAASARCAAAPSGSEMPTVGEPEVRQQTPSAPEQPGSAENKPADHSLSSTLLATATESEGGALQTPPLEPSSSSPPSATPQGMRPSSLWKGAGTALAMPRVWTLAGCTRDTDVDQCTGADASLASYVDCAVPSRARFGYISDMALWTDATGDTQVLLVDQTHHALRILDARGGVSTYVGPADYEMAGVDLTSATITPAVDSLPRGLVYPCCLAVGALIKERSPTLLSATTTTAAAAATSTMITPQPYLYSSSPLLFTASAVTGTVSVLLPVSQRSAPTPWNVLENQHRGNATENCEVEGEARNGDKDGASVLAAIRGALELGVATEGRRSIGEVATPSLKHVVVGWAADEAGGGKAESAQQALQYLRLRFPWLLTPSVPPLSPRLVAGCSCHVSGKRRGAAAAASAPASEAVGLHCHSASSRKGVGAPLSVLHVCGDGKPAKSPATSTAAVRAVQQRLLFQSPPRCPPIITGRSTSACTNALTVAAVKTVAALSLKPSLLSMPPPHMVEVLHGAPLNDDAGGDGAAVSHRRVPCAGSSSPSRAALPLRSDGDPKIREGQDSSRQSSSSSSHLQLEDGEDKVQSGHGSHRRGGRAAERRLAPPMESVSRSPSGNSSPEQQPVGLATNPPVLPSSTYAGRFQDEAPEQRQKRLRSTLEVPIRTRPSGAPRALHRQAQEEGDEYDGSPSQGRQPEDCKSSSRSPHGRTTSPSNRSGRGSPPLTPRAMAAHQLMQRHRTSRSSTAPHMASAEGRPLGSTERENVAFTDGRDDAAPWPQTQQQDGSQGRTARTEPLTASNASDRRNLPPCHADRQLLGAYDAAVRRLFCVYDYLATKTVTTSMTATAGAAPVAAGATSVSGGANPRTTSAGSRRSSAPTLWAMRQSRQVEQYTMSFTAFFRFVVLTGYADYLAELAEAAVTAAAATDAHTVARDGSVPSLASLLCRLSQVPPRQSSCRRGGAGARHKGSSAPAASSRALGGVASAGAPSSLSHARPSTSSDVLVVPLAATDARAITAVLYACGVQRRGYHTVTQMDFQSFRRAALLLYTWARTARCAETAKQSEAAGSDGAHSRRCSARRNAPRRNGADAATYAYVDTVPSLDALTSEEVVAAYSAVYERAVCCIPALAMSFGPGGSMRASHGAPSPLSAVNAGSSGATPLRRRHYKEAMGSRRCGGGVGDTAGGVDDVITPPVSPITTTEAADDVSCLVIDGDDALKVREAVAGEAPWAAQNSDDADALFPPWVLTPHETFALDELLRLLQRNESTLRQLFEAYSVPITLHRSPQYEAPLSAALAAASNACSLPLSSPDISRDLGDGGRAMAQQPRHGPVSPPATTRLDASPAVARSPVGKHRNRHAVGSACTTRPAMPVPATAAALDVVHGAAVLSSVSTSQQDLSWKVQQIYTMSALENQEAYERTSQVLHVMTFKLFIELWRTLDVFPSLTRMGAMQQAFSDALTTPMLRGLASAPRGDADAPLQPQAQPPSSSPTPSAALLSRRTVAQLCTHGGLPYACFVESFVRVALTVFSHSVDRTAYPTATAKTAGLMRWCNKQVALGLAAKRVQQQQRLSATVAGVHASSSRLYMTPTGASSVSALAARAPRAVGFFPHQLRLFCVPSASRSSAAPPKTG
ncbi:hypothetical protein LSCM1_06933 [Leishmania martiniquensis]|uniref:Uncharacterized protein n=1 Tax=Leishmania martiniquensis TaxID=1580590 RepID=A0A836HB43_9TRYP|nr:hypothetical protein LSCM1_06933 [Leishmania martiniquensis]